MFNSKRMKKLKGKSIYQLFILMILVAFLLTITSIVIIYKIIYNEKKMLLKELCETQKDIIQSIYKETNDVNTVLNILHKQQEITKGLGTTGEFAIGYLKNDTMFYFLRMRQKVLINNEPIPLSSDRGAPMRYALTKNTGFIEGLDYKGDRVFSYCSYIPELSWGIVTKMNLSEIRLPFYKAGIYAIIFSFILILIATILFRIISHPITKKIEESEENYRRLFEYSAIPIWKEDYSEIKKYFDNLKSSGVTDFRTYFETHKDEINHLASLIKVLEINQKSVEFFKAESKEDVIKNMLFYFNEQSLVVFKEELIVLAEGGKLFDCEMPIRTLSGEIKTLAMHLSVVKGYEDTLSNVLVSFIDLTQRKQAEEALRTSQMRTSTILQSIADTFYSLDSQWRFTEVNPAAEHAPFGRPASELLGKVIWDLYPNLVGTRIHQHYLDAAKKCASEQYVAQSPLNKRWYEVFMHGLVGGVDVYMRDITERMKVEEALRESEEKFRVVATNTPDHILIQDKDLCYTMVINPQLGLSEQNMIGKTDFEILSKEDAENLTATKKKVLTTGKSEYLTISIAALNGEIQYFDGAYIPKYNTKNEIDGIIGYFKNITERRKTEEALKQSEERFKAMAEASPLGIGVVGIPEGKFFYVNEAYAKAFGYDKNELINNVTPHIYWENSDRDSILRELEKNKNVVDYEVRFKRKNGTMFWGYSFIRPIVYDGRPALIGVFTDISVRKKAEADLKESEEKLWSILNATKETIYMFDRDGKFTTSNSTGLKRLNNITEKELLGHHFSEFMSAELSGQRQAKLDEVFSTGKPVEFEDERNGMIFHHNFFPVFKDDEVANVVTYSTDITEQKNNVQKLIQSRKEWIETFDLIPDMITILDNRQKIIRANKAASDKLGIAYQDLLGLHCFQCLHGMEESPSYCPHALMLKDGKEHVADFHEDKLGIDLLVSVTPIYDNDGNITGSVHIARDITERKKFENELKEKNAELEEINATKDKFFNIIAHDMKNPYISLIGASELLYENANKYDRDKIVTLSKILNDSAKNGYDMLLNLLDWARSQAGSMIFQPEPINLKELINKNLLSTIEYASSKHITLNFDITNDMVHADKNMLESILRNLINNALKFTPQDGEVTVGAKRENDSMIFFVKDTGVGIDKSDFNKLFRTDIKFNKPGTEREGGTGLGLLLCKEFIEKHGGKIWLESQVGKGTTFYFNLGML
jgi:PAS domain S-box-containing protein